jgi:TetR/AcrR family transcriptional repressor of bet genes
MPKKRTDSEHSRETIVSAATSLVKRSGADDVTVADVATEVGCAKGLVHYHFKSKQRLWEAVAIDLAEGRRAQWTGALEGRTPREAIDATWNLLVDESANGVVLAWTTLFGPGRHLPEHQVSEAHRGFSRTLGGAARQMLERSGERVRIPESELGLLLGAVVTGMGFELLGGADQGGLEGSYAAAWLGILSFAEPPA